MSSSTVAVDVDGRTLRLSNLDKVLYPEVGLTKGEVSPTTPRWRRCCCRTSPAGR